MPSEWPENGIERFMGPISSSLQPEADGCWVRHADHRARLEEVEAERIEAALAGLEAIRIARELQSQLHALRGVLEEEIERLRAYDTPTARAVAARLQAILDQSTPEPSAVSGDVAGEGT